VTVNAPASIARNQYRSIRSDLERSIRRSRAQGVDNKTLASLFAHVLRESSEEVVA
jgi:hypothetical protein